jgi:hypothetical protein
MQKTNTILILSALIVLLPFLGFPQSWDNFFFVIFGLTIFTLTYLSKKGQSLFKKKENSFSNNGRDPNTTPTQ